MHDCCVVLSCDLYWPIRIGTSVSCCLWKPGWMRDLISRCKRSNINPSRLSWRWIYYLTLFTKHIPVYIYIVLSLENDNIRIQRIIGSYLIWQFLKYEHINWSVSNTKPPLTKIGGFYIANLYPKPQKHQNKKNCQIFFLYGIILHTTKCMYTDTNLIYNRQMISNFFSHTQIIFQTYSEFGLPNYQLETETYKAIEERRKIESSSVDLKTVGQH